MIGHALEVLEFERVLERVARRASSDPGRARILALRPSDDHDQVASELRRVAAVMAFVEEGTNWALGPIPDVQEELSQLSVEGAVLSPIGLHRIGVLLQSSRLLADELRGRERRDPALDSIAERLVEHERA